MIGYITHISSIHDIVVVIQFDDILYDDTLYDEIADNIIIAGNINDGIIMTSKGIGSPIRVESIERKYCKP